MPADWFRYFVNESITSSSLHRSTIQSGKKKQIKLQGIMKEITFTR